MAYTYPSRLPWIFSEPHWKSMGFPEISRVTWMLGLCPILVIAVLYTYRVIFGNNVSSQWWAISISHWPKMGSARCLPGPMFPSPYVPRFMILVPMFPMFPSPYVTQKYFPVPLLPKLISPSPCVPQYPCFPYSPVPMFPSPYVPQSICFPVPIDVHQSLCSPGPMFPQLIHQSYSTEVFSIPYVPPNMFPSPYVPPTSSPVPITYVPQSYSTEVFSIPYVPQCLCSPVPMFPKHVPQALWNIGTGEYLRET